ncbi:hypothetical protein B0T26DRAFT_749562 [Lasiosphaeria miniovina]|uniref:Short-chain dehydrogenase n=1 Tax=Lasiosphaeria miniovina TaxID=1954250 RepID=A0AA40AUA2_9PEZI|nr:uncharacterized protein B0T26DRAFT_749562 [Lasiosphaeria miniovina]KAK0722111.1 hypothetical protein B0T26DRAFT_749562 [Lasiosphaeria miniovina]
MSNYGSHTNGTELVSDFSARVDGRTFLITGPSQGGIGAETAVSLAHAKPAMLILLGRSLERIQPVIDAVRALNTSVQVKFVLVDLASLDSVREAADTILADASIPHIDVVINNAALMACPFELSKDGLEMQLAAGFLGHFVLTNRLLPKILAAPPGARIVNVSSIGNRAGGIRWDDPNFTAETPDKYDTWAAYGQAKTACVLYSIELNRRLSKSTPGVRSYSLNPGAVGTNLGRTLTPELIRIATIRIMGREDYMPAFKTLQQGCATTLRAALDPTLEAEDGVYLNDCQLTTDPAWIAPWALDAAAAPRLWALAEGLVGEKFDI